MAKIPIKSAKASMTSNGACIINAKYIVRGSDCRDNLVLHAKQLQGQDIIIDVENDTDVTPTGLVHATFISVPMPKQTLLETVSLAEDIWTKRTQQQVLRGNGQRQAPAQPRREATSEADDDTQPTGKADDGSKAETKADDKKDGKQEPVITDADNGTAPPL